MNHMTYTEDNLAIIVSLFRLYSKIFTHIRKEYLKESLIKGRCIYEDNVLIIYTTYKRDNRIGNYTAKRGSVTINQIVNKVPGNGSAVAVMQRFISFINTDICLSVRQDNERAIAFYKKMKFIECGKTFWKEGSIPGLVFLYCK